jgi:hypothetical protein
MGKGNPGGQHQAGVIGPSRYSINPVPRMQPATVRVKPRMPITGVGVAAHARTRCAGSARGDGHVLDRSGQARRRPVAGGRLHHHDQHLGMCARVIGAEQSVDLLLRRLQSLRRHRRAAAAPRCGGPVRPGRARHRRAQLGCAGDVAALRVEGHSDLQPLVTHWYIAHRA